MTIELEANNVYYKKFGEYPDLKNPRDFNEKIQWLKIYDQDPLQITLCDKIQVKQWVSNKIGEKYVIPFYDGYPSVWKTNHMSGDAEFIDGKEDEESALERLNKRLKKKHGVKKGEWAYRLIEPKILKERKLNINVDYKFHCVEGKIKWMQMIWDRTHYGKECVFDEYGKLTDLISEPRNQHKPRDMICSYNQFLELKKIAEKLCEGWKYVRVDLYYDKQPWFGEMTFWPASGTFPRHKDIIKLGELLDFDRTTSKPPILV